MERHYTKVFAGIVLFQMLLAGLFPITSDEAYFYTWAVNLDVNYYDHPPVIAWIIRLFSLPGEHIFFFRLFAVLTGAVVAVGLLRIGRVLTGDPEKARLVSLVYLVAPLHVLFIPITTDTPLFLFTFLTGVFFFQGVRRDSAPMILAAGGFLSLAILSKYFAGLLLIGVAGYLLLRWSLRSLRHAMLLAVGAAPLILLHLYWNYNDCWLTLMFNVFNRNKDHALGFGTFAAFLGFQVYLATPWVLWALVRNGGVIARGVRRDDNLFFHLAAIPLALLALLAFFDTSLHWTLSFYPFVFLLLVYVDARTLRRLVGWSAGFSLVHAVVIVAVLLIPLDTARKHLPPVDRYFSDIIMGFHGDEVYAALAPYEKDYFFGTPGYTTASLMAYQSGRPFLVIGDEDRNGRNDDKVTDFRALDGKNILILSTLVFNQRELDRYADWFDRFTVETLRVRGAEYRLGFGRGFRFGRYRETFLERILKDCYDIPDFLPVGKCFFHSWYFPERFPDE